jgi:tetratricopeptide (TPR) repeat protein
MNNFSNRRDREEMQELLKAYNSLKAGRPMSFVEEEDFEKIIDYFDEKENMVAAMEAADIALQHFPYSAAMMLKMSDLLLAQQLYDDALPLLEQAEIYDSTHIDLYILKTDAYLGLDQPEKAAKLLDKALEILECDDRVNLLFELADVYDDHNEFDSVFTCLELLLKEDPNNEEALLKICFWADFTGNCEKSIKLHQWIIDEYPFNELAWFNLATAFQGLKLYEKAIDAYQYALVIDEKLDIAYRNMGDAFIRLRRFKEAIESLEKVLELHQAEDVIYEAIGHCNDKLFNYHAARANYRKASQLNPSDSRIYYKIAATYCNEARWESAIKHLETAMRMHPNQADYNLLMGDCKMEQGKLKEAIQFYSTAIRAKPKNVLSRESLIRCLLKAEYTDEAMEQCHHASLATNQHPIFHYYTSAAYFIAGKNKEALVHLEKGLSDNPKLFKKVLDLIPSILQRPNAVDLINKYIKRKKTGRTKK